MAKTETFGYLSSDTRASIEMNLCNILSISSLKIKASTFSAESQELLLEIASSVLVNKSVRDQAESPLLIQMVRYKQLNRHEISNNSSFSLFAAS